jgi:hypothetical protein
MDDTTINDNEAKTQTAEPTPEPTAAGWTSKVDEILEDWRLRAWASQTAHYRVAQTLRGRNYALGLPVVILTTVVGTSIFASLTENDLHIAARIFVGAISVLAAILAGIQTFFGFQQRADQHVLAADWYAAIRRKVEQIQALPYELRGDPRESLDGVRKEMNHVGSQFPEIGQQEWDKTARKFGIKEPPRRSKPDPKQETVTLP